MSHHLNLHNSSMKIYFFFWRKVTHLLFRKTDVLENGRGKWKVCTLFSNMFRLGIASSSMNIRWPLTLLRSPGDLMSQIIHWRMHKNLHVNQIGWQKGPFLRSDIPVLFKVISWHTKRRVGLHAHPYIARWVLPAGSCSFTHPHVRACACNYTCHSMTRNLFLDNLHGFYCHLFKIINI